MTAALTPQERQRDRAFTDFENTLGDELRSLLDECDDVSIRPNGKVRCVKPGHGRQTHPTLTVTPDESELLARAILQCQRPVPELNETTQAVDCKMPLSDGKHFARVHIDGPPAVSPGYQICIRKQRALALPLREGWILPGYLDPYYEDVFRWSILTRQNVIFCGKMMTGKTSLRNTYFRMMKELDPEREIVEILDVDETVCTHDGYTALHINKDRSAQEHARAFVRMSADAVGVNELRGAEAYDLVHNLWISDHDGSSTTLHVSDPDEAIWRLTTLIAQSGQTPQPEVIAKAVNILVFLKYSPTIGRRVTEVVQIKGLKSDGHVDFKPLGPKFDWPEEENAKEYVRRTAA